MGSHQVLPGVILYELRRLIGKTHHRTKIAILEERIMVGLSEFESESPAPQAGRIPSYPTDPWMKGL